jgi:hypothetical protein
MIDGGCGRGRTKKANWRNWGTFVLPITVKGVLRTRRSLTKAAGLAFGAFFALSGGRTSALADDDCDNPYKAEHNKHCCFLRGTKILTHFGYRSVEDLSVGDFLPTTFAGTSSIQRIASYSFKKSDLSRPWPKRVRPVRILRSALDDNVPSTDLYLTRGHALFVDGVLVPVANLINGTTIALDDANELDVLEYFHIKLERHDVIDAQGASCETQQSGDTEFEGIREHEVSNANAAPCAPIVSYCGGRGELKSRLRSALSFSVDRRQQLDVLRDRLEERGSLMWQNPALPKSSAHTAIRL